MDTDTFMRSNSPSSPEPINVAVHLRRMADAQPFKRAVVCPHRRDRHGRVAYTQLTFRQLDLESDRLAFGLRQAGIDRGTRTILMVRPGLEFFALVFAVFKIGAVPVVVDPGMGVRRMLECFRETQPTAFIGISPAHVLRVLYRGFFDTIRVWVTVGRRWFWGGHTLSMLRADTDAPYPMAATAREETPAILFTTGSTGPAKGVVYSHGIFDAQIRRIKRQYGIGPDEIDLPTFPLFALFDPALGMTAVVPDMDPTRPARANPVKIIEAVTNHGVTNMFASPALLNRVGGYGKAHGVRLPSLKRVISAGAPVMPAILDQFAALLTPEAEIYTGYGATEAMPVASLGSREILSETRAASEGGHGVCVGKPIEGIDVRIIRISDSPIQNWSPDLTVADETVGEITVRGDIVTSQYHARPEADAAAKIRDGDTLWHRMGDLGRVDTRGRIWFYGRKSHRVATDTGPLFTIACEAIFNNHPRVFRSALVGVGAKPHQKPVMCIELHPHDDGRQKERLTRDLLDLAQSTAWTRSIDTFLYHDGFPVDIRHNSKIFREKLARWAEKKLK